MVEPLADAAFGYAPGKLLLFGEHAVVYGQPAIAVSIDRGIRVAVSALDGPSGPVMRTSGLGLAAPVCVGPEPAGPAVLQRALTRLVELYGTDVRELQFVVDSAIVAGAGLGSSAALSVAMIRGVRRFLTLSRDDEAVLAHALELERVFHGNPSGVDHTVIARGGALSYLRGEKGPQFQRVVLGRPLHLAVGVAGPHAGTKRAVSALRERASRHGAVYEHLFAGVGMLAREARTALENGHLAAVGELMNVNQGYLNALGVSTPAIETLCHVARERGALGAKLTGAGGGGAMLALCDGDAAGAVASAFEDAGFSAFTTVVSNESVG